MCIGVLTCHLEPMQVPDYRLVVYLTALHLYCIRDTLEEALSCHQCDVYVCLLAKLPKHADVEPEMLW